MKKIKNKKQFINFLKSYNINYYKEDCYNDLVNKHIDYIDNTGDYSNQYLFENFITSELVEKKIIEDLQNGDGLLRLYHFLDDVRLNEEIYKLNGYGNLENALVEDLKNLRDDLLKNLEK